MTKKAAKHRKPNRQKKRHALPKLLGLAAAATVTTGVVGVAGAFGAWQYAKQQHQTRRKHTQGFHGEIGAKRYVGQVHKVGNYLTLVTDGASYDIYDPLFKLDTLYQADKTPSDSGSQCKKLIDNVHCDHVCISAELSQKGRYGYLGRLDYQLTVIDLCDQPTY